MVNRKYDVLVRNGRERYLVIPERDYQALREKLEDQADFRAIEQSKKRQARSPRYTLEQIKRDLRSSKRPKRKSA